MWDVHDEVHWEAKCMTNRAYARGANDEGFFARYRVFPIWIGRPARIGEGVIRN